MATHSSILAWRTPWTEEPGELQSMGLQELDTTWRRKPPQSGQTHLLSCFLDVAFMSAHRAGLYFPATMSFLTWFSCTWCTPFAYLLLKIISGVQGSSEIPPLSHVLMDPASTWGGGKNNSFLWSLYSVIYFFYLWGLGLSITLCELCL